MDHGTQERCHLRMRQRPQLLRVATPREFQVRAVSFSRTRFNAHSERPTFRTYACNYRMIVVADTLHLRSVSNVAAVNRA